MSETAAPQSNSPFAVPVPPARIEADANTARNNSQVVRHDLAEARRVADLSPQERHFETVRTEQGWPQGERLGDRKLGDAEYGRLTYAEKHQYAERRTELASAQDPASDGTAPSDTPAEVKHKIGEIELTETELRGLMERKAVEESRKLSLPADPSKYQLTLPKDFVAPQGVEFKFDEADPAVHLARDFAHKNGLSQEQFSRMTSIYAAVKVQELANLQTARDAEVGKLGATGSQRVTAIQNFLRAHLGDATAQPFINTMVMAKQVEGWEKIMQKMTNQSGGSFSGGGRSPDGPTKLSDAEYSAMSYSEQKAYAERMSSGNGRR